MEKTETDYLMDEVFGERLLISKYADQSELSSNIRAARAILHSFSEVVIRINPHKIEFGHKNPEYTICEQLGDRKGIMGEKGITAGLTSIFCKSAHLNYQNTLQRGRMILRRG